MGRFARGARALAALGCGLVLAACGQGGGNGGGGPTPRVSCAAGARPAKFAVPSFKGVNYGEPFTVSGDWVGSAWLRSGTGRDDEWSQTRPSLDADLTFIESHHLGSTIRIFLGLDQAMRWDSTTGFSGFYDGVLANFQSSLQIVAAHHMKAFVVLFDQEVTSTPGNFRFQALDGSHQTMRENYLRAEYQFLRRFGSDPAVVGWDLFNEAYNSLGRDGGLPAPRAGQDQGVSPGYDNDTIHAWLRDLHATAVCAAPSAWYTVSDTTELVGSSPDTGLYDGAVDFYDLHIYDDAPAVPDLRALKLPAILGEVGADTSHFGDQKADVTALRMALDGGRAQGAAAVLAHEDDSILYPRGRGGLTPAGSLLAAYPG